MILTKRNYSNTLLYKFWFSMNSKTLKYISILEIIYLFYT